MNALTHEIRSAAAAVTPSKPVAPTTKSIWTRLLDAMIESRLRQAEREIRQHLHLVPADVLARSGFAATYKDAGKLPFMK